MQGMRACSKHVARCCRSQVVCSCKSQPNQEGGASGHLLVASSSSRSSSRPSYEWRPSQDERASLIRRHGAPAAHRLVASSSSRSSSKSNSARPCAASTRLRPST